MAKPIKFNLILDNKPVRSLDDLRDNFNIEDLLAAYRNGSLKRWLESRELTAEIAELDKISDDDINAARELCRIFRADCAEEQLEAAAYPFEFRQNEAEKLIRYKDLAEQKNEIIRAYHEGYEKLLKEMEEKGDDYAFVKSGVAELFRRYVELYRLDDWGFYHRFIKTHPLVILAMLANADMRPLIVKKPEEIFGNLNIAVSTQSSLPSSSDAEAFYKIWEKNDRQTELFRRYPGMLTIAGQSEKAKLRNRNQPILLLDCEANQALNGTVLNSSELSVDPSAITYIPLAAIPSTISRENHTAGVSSSMPNLVKTFGDIPLAAISSTISRENHAAGVSSSMPSHVKTFAGETEGYWKDIEPRGKRFMVIKMEEGNFIRNAGKNGEELKAEDVNGKFPILDGIDYKSNNASHQLMYMEI
jgi:hypothetical protein